MTQAGSPPQSTQDHGVVTRSTTDLVKAAVSGWMGTAMEFMDFQLYSLAAAIVFNKIFFPNVSPAIGLIAAFATYGVGYVAWPGGRLRGGRRAAGHSEYRRARVPGAGAGHHCRSDPHDA